MFMKLLKRMVALALAMLLAALALAGVAEEVDISSEGIEAEVAEAAEVLAEDAGDPEPEAAPEPEADAAPNAGDVPISGDIFPSNDFRDYIRNHYDENGDERLSPEEIAAATEMDLGYLYINDLRGLSVFTNLQILKCNAVEGLKALDISGMKRLTEVQAAYGVLTALDASGCSALKRLDCSYNQLTSLKLTGCKKLADLDCSGNRLSKLDLSPAKGLKEVNCSRSEVKQLKLPGKAKLTRLDCSSNLLEKLDVSGCAKLKALDCCNNRLAALDLRKLSQLTEAKCDGNKLGKGALKLPGTSKLKTLHCRHNPMTALDVSGQKALRTLDCLGSKVKSLKLNRGLTTLLCGATKLEKLDLSKQEALRCLDCTEAPLKRLTLGRKPKLERLFISDTKLDRVDLGGCSAWIRAVAGSHVYERCEGSWISWRQGTKRGLVSNTATEFTDGDQVLYRPGKATGVAFEAETLTLAAGETAPLRLSLSPDGAATACKFSVADKSVVRVKRDANSDALFIVRALGPGATTVTVKTAEGQKAVLSVTVR